MEGIVRWNPATQKYHLLVGGKDTGLKSKDPTYFEYHQRRNDVEKLTKLGVTKFMIEDIGVVTMTAPVTQLDTVVVPTGKQYTIDQKFRMMDRLIKMTIRGSSKGMLITGKGGIGKTYSVLKLLQKMGKTDYMKARAEAGITEIEPEDDFDDIKEKIGKLADLGSSGDYVVFKGYATAAALYRLLYEHKNRIIVFDDCDSILRNEDAVNVLKGGLDSYEERWISWNTNAAAPDLPPCFKFEGQVIIICNQEMEKINEAVRTRCFKVDVSMTYEQRIQRMRSVLADVMPEVDISLKTEALDLIANNLDTAKDVSFRSLMNVIKIRCESEIDDEKDLSWQDVALYSISQQW